MGLVAAKQPYKNALLRLTDSRSVASQDSKKECSVTVRKSQPNEQKMQAGQWAAATNYLLQQMAIKGKLTQTVPCLPHPSAHANSTRPM
eukprot:10646383-Ditylum_brightwellii.AAC.1